MGVRPPRKKTSGRGRKLGVGGGQAGQTTFPTRIKSRFRRRRKKFTTIDIVERQLNNKKRRKRTIKSTIEGASHGWHSEKKENSKEMRPEEQWSDEQQVRIYKKWVKTKNDPARSTVGGSDRKNYQREKNNGGDIIT